MKRYFILFAAVMLLAGSFGFAKESIIIDFTLLDTDCCADEETGIAKENSRTVMDYSVSAGASFTDSQKALLKTSLALPNWEVELNSSSRNVNAVANSRVVAAPVRDAEEVKVPFKGSNVMGVRVLFPTWSANAYAKIKPPFEIQAYEPLADCDENGIRQEQTDDQKGKYLFEEGYGLVRNVGVIKSISVSSYGENFPHGLYVLLKDNDNIERRYFMGYLMFDGWKTLIWNNPEYATELRTRAVKHVPIYPRGTPFVKFQGFQITRDSMDDGGDFIGYFKDVKIIYDLAVTTADRDIDDEALWGIIKKKETARQVREMERFGDDQVLRYLEKQKIALDSETFKADDYLGTDDEDSTSSSGTAAEK